MPDKVYFLGCDIGSLTAKAVIIGPSGIASSAICKVKPQPSESADTVVKAALSKIGASLSEIKKICATGYGRNDIPLADMNMSEISCHARGAFFLDDSIRTVIDIGGQDCKVIRLNDDGNVDEFLMNDKCAAGTGRSLEILARSIGVTFQDLGGLSLKSSRRIEIPNKCSIFMELEVLQYLYRGAKIKDIASGINEAVAKRVAGLAACVGIKSPICLTGGVAKNEGVKKHLEKILSVRFLKLDIDPQIIGALGAAVYAMRAV